MGQESLCVQVDEVCGKGVALCSGWRSWWDRSPSLFRSEEWVRQESLCVQVGGVGGLESLCIQVGGVGGTGVTLCSGGRSGWYRSPSVFRWEEWVGQQSQADPSY